MSDFETHRVCKNCFKNTITKNPPILEKYHSRDMKCNTCSLEWVDINIGYYPPNNMWYEVRPRPFNSEQVLCRYKMTGQCYRDWRCRMAHNPLELEIWTEEERLIMSKKRPSKPKFGCIICRKDFRDNDNLKTHLMGKEHETKTYNMWILPDVGSSIEYTGPIRARPKLPYGKDLYELCRTFARHGKCQYSSGCKYAHSEEELKVWTEALTAERYERHDKKYSHSSFDKGASSSRSHSSSQDGASRYPSGSSESQHQGRSRSRSKQPPSSGGDNVEGQPDHVKEVYRRIRDFGIEPCLRNFPKHIQITCSRSLTITVEERNKANELKWVFGLKTTQPEYLSSIMLYDHKNMFILGEIAKCSTKGAGRNDLKQPYAPNRTSYVVQQAFNQELYFEIALLCKPEVGVYKVKIVFQIRDDILVAKEVKVKMQGDGFKNVTENFRIATKREPFKAVMVEDLLKVNWEYSFELMNSKPNEIYPMPSYVENKVISDWYDKMNDQITKQYYDKRFHTLLFLEEFEHKRSLMKYDLPDQKITFHNVDKQITIKNDYGRDFLERARGETRFITFKLNHRLYEGYRSFRPPKVVYIIPNGTKKAYEFSIFHTGADYVIVSITTEFIKACQCSKGLALVRFTHGREDYVRMHEALDTISFSIVFPVHKWIEKPLYWDEDHLLGLLDYEQLTVQQKIAVYSIIDSKYQTFPTIICGPFGCGKTKTLSVAAKLIAQAFYRARILIVTTTNSCANMYIELLRCYFDTLTMLREKQGNRRIMYRHFAMTQKIHLNKEVNDFANIENVGEGPDQVYKRINFFNLKQCTIIVTTITACATLIPPQSQFKSKFLFTHIFIDEAAQVIEPEACIALSLAGASTKIALAGDIHQSRPLVLSKYGKQYNLDQSLLERLEMLPEYETEGLYKCKVNLLENFRSQHLIVEFLSELFYDNTLVANPPSLVGPINFPALSFLHVSGDEQSLYGFPSYYNEEEAHLTMKALRKFVAGGVNVDKIAVVTTYKAQVRLIHEALKQEDSNCKRMGHFKYDDQYCRDNNCINNHTIQVFNLERIQGREYDLIIVNTVRTVSEVPEDLSLEERLDLGLLDDVAQFNTILTRARGWVLVIGDADCLTRVGGCSNVWSKYVEACEQVNGFFRTCMEFEAFKMKIGDTKETKGPSLRIPKKVEIPKSKVSIASTEESQLELCTTENTFDSKYNSLQSFMNTCYQELTVSTNQEVKEAIHEQLAHAKVAIEAMENQRYIEQKCILSNYQAGSVPQESACNQHIAIPQPDLIQYKAMLAPTKQEQLFPKGPI